MSDQDGGKIAADIITKSAKAAGSIAQNPENAGKIATDILSKAGKSAMGKTTQQAQGAGQGM